jgi:parallel beta-helix repeat protein
LDYCPCSVVADNIVENPAGIGIYLSSSPKTNVSGNNVRCKNYGVYAEDSIGIMISGNIVRQSPHNVNADCFKLNDCPEAAIDNNKLFVYYGGGITAESNCRTMGNFIVCADSSQIAIRVWGGKSGYIVAQNMSNGTFAVANGTNAVIQNNITMTSTAFVDVVYTLTNLTTDGFAKALTEDDFEFTLTAASGYTLPDTITVTMGGTALAAGTGYAYDKATGKVTVYRVSGAVEITAKM